MPTNTQILDLAQGASYLAANAVSKGQLFPTGKLNPLLPRQIYAVWFILSKIHTLDPTNAALTPCCNYLWELCGKYGIAAQGLSGSGGNVPPPTGTQGYPIYLTQDNFSTATLYPNTNIFGTNIAIFLNQINRYLAPGTEFSVAAAGVTILLDGFDATANDYELVIEKVYTA